MNKNIDKLNQSAHHVTGIEGFKLNFTISKGDFLYRPPQKEELPEPTYYPDDETIFPAINLNPRYTFDSFVIGSSNRFAQATSEAVSNDPGSKYNPLFIYGGVGLGKTHLLHAIGHRIKTTIPNKNVLYVTCEKFTQEMKKQYAAIQQKIF